MHLRRFRCRRLFAVGIISAKGGLKVLPGKLMVGLNVENASISNDWRVIKELVFLSLASMFSVSGCAS